MYTTFISTIKVSKNRALCEMIDHDHPTFFLIEQLLTDFISFILQKGENNKSSKGIPPPPPNRIFSFNRVSNKQKQHSDWQHQQQQPIPSAPPLFTTNHSVSQPTKPDTLQAAHLHNQSQEQMSNPARTSETGPDHNANGSWFRFRRGKGSH